MPISGIIMKPFRILSEIKIKKYFTKYFTIFKILIYRNKWFNIVSPLYLIMAIHLLKTAKTLHLTNQKIAFQQI